MGSLKTLKRMLVDDRKSIPATIMTKLIRKNITNVLPDKIFLKMRYKTIFHKKLNLKNPQTFNEKLQWLKLYDRNPNYCNMVDKYEVRAYIADKIGGQYLIPCLGIWDTPDEIDYDKLPDKFVLKCTHDSGSVMICDKKTLDKNKINTYFSEKIKKNMFWWGREWPYKDLKGRIIAEQFMTDESGELRDYKFMCFNGELKCTFVCSDRFSGKGLHVTFFDKEWNVMPFERNHPAVKEGLPKPKMYDEMVRLAEILSKGIPFVRVDFYEVNGQIYFGELTFFPGNGMEAFQPEEWDYRLGEWIKLPKIEKSKENL